MFNLVTSICVSEKTSGADVSPNAKRRNEDPRLVYWRCVFLFCLFARKSNPEVRVVVYTNDTQPVVIDDVDIRRELSKRSVEVVEMPFRKFDPGHHSKRFRNAFYKLDVIEALGQVKNPSLLLDSDCLCVADLSDLSEIIKMPDTLLLQDTYQRNHEPNRPRPHGMSMVQMTDFYKNLALFPVVRQYATWWGGELIGGTPEIFLEVSQMMRKVFDHAQERTKAGEELILPSGEGIFDGDELMSSCVYFHLDKKIVDSYGRFSKRMLTQDGFYSVEPGDENLPIWHLPLEKTTGFVDLFNRVVASQYNEFDNLAINDLGKEYAGAVGLNRVKRHDFVSRLNRVFIQFKIWGGCLKRSVSLR